MQESISTQPLTFVIGPRLSKRREVADEVPTHAANLMRSLWDIEDVMHAHGMSLFEDTKPEVHMTSDRETVFLRSAVILLCAAWEAYVEDLARNSVLLLLEKVKNADDLPVSLKRKISKDIKESKHELSAWKLAGDAWRQFALEKFDEEVQSVHSPKSGKIRQLFKEWLGIEDVTKSWTWEYFESPVVCSLIDGFVETRGAIAHGRQPKYAVSMNLLAYWQLVVVECSFRMNNEMDSNLTHTIGSNPWGQLRQTVDWQRFTKQGGD